MNIKKLIIYLVIGAVIIFVAYYLKEQMKPADPDLNGEDNDGSNSMLAIDSDGEFVFVSPAQATENGTLAMQAYNNMKGVKAHDVDLWRRIYDKAINERPIYWTNFLVNYFYTDQKQVFSKRLSGENFDHVANVWSSTAEKKKIKAEMKKIKQKILSEAKRWESTLWKELEK